MNRVDLPTFGRPTSAMTEDGAAELVVGKKEVALAGVRVHPLIPVIQFCAACRPISFVIPTVTQ